MVPADDLEAKITVMRDGHGQAHLVDKAERTLDRDTCAVMAFEVYETEEGDSST